MFLCKAQETKQWQRTLIGNIIRVENIFLNER